MAKGFDVIHAKSAVKSHNKFDLSQTHLTTMDFGEIVPLLAEEVVPGDKFSVKGSYFSRMAPLVKPTYGKFSFRTMSSFVPYFQVADDAESWLAGSTIWEGDNTSWRRISYPQYVAYLRSIGTDLTDSAETQVILSEMGVASASSYNRVTFDTSLGVAEFTSTSSPTLPKITYEYDWIMTDSAGTQHCYVFRGVSKYRLKVLNALGYAIPQNVDLRTSSLWYSSYGTSAFLSAMPLLCFAKAYNDYMSQSQRYNNSSLTALLKCVKEKKDASGFAGTTGILSSGAVQTIMNSIKVQYENDYFVSAWQSPNAPRNSLESITQVIVPQGSNGQNSTINSNAQNTYAGSVGSYLSQRTLDFLKSFDDWVRRNNYSGSRAVQQVYSRFGIKTDDYRSNYAHVISTDIIPIQVGDVTATAEGSNVPLGDYAGKGIVSGDKGFSFESNDYGMLFVFGWYTVQPMNAFGFDRTVLKASPLDFYNPEFDGLGANAISYGELFANPIPQSTDSSLDNATFGFTERYNEYRFGRDKITGEFRNYHKNADMNTWHTGRLLNDVRASGNMVAQNTNVNAMAQANSEFNRIFSVTDDSVNHFYMTAQFNVSAVRPMLSINQVPRLGEGDTAVPRNGNVIN